MAITQTDLNNLETRIKLEITQEQADLRHNLDSKLWIYFLTVDALDKKSAVNDNILANMSKNFEEMKESFDKLVTKIDWLDAKYSGKWAEKVLVWLWAAIWVSLIWALMALLLNKWI